MSLSAAYFDDLYAASSDPWGLASRAYEARKYALTLASLPRPRYKRAFEPGCSIGVLTRLLATRADLVIATDTAVEALSAARRGGLPQNVRLGQAEVPNDWPEGPFDLIIFSELGYYFDDDDLSAFIGRVIDSLDGHLVAVHWRQPVPAYPRNAAQVHDALRSSRLHRLAHYEDAHFLLDVFSTPLSSGIPGPDEGEIVS